MSNNPSADEPEIINPGGKGSTTATYRDTYVRYSSETKRVSPAAFLISLLAFFLSFLPIIGVCVALFAILFSKIKRTSPVLAIVAFVIGCVTTTIFLLIVAFFNLIF